MVRMHIVNNVNVIFNVIVSLTSYLSGTSFDVTGNITICRAHNVAIDRRYDNLLHLDVDCEVSHSHF